MNAVGCSRPMIGQGKRFVKSKSRFDVPLLLPIPLLLILFCFAYLLVSCCWSELPAFDFTRNNEEGVRETFSFSDFDAKESESESSTTITIISPPRPILYTYVDYHDDNNKSNNIDMSRAGHEALVELWKESWTAVGWNPVVLTIHHTQRHARFPEWDELLKKLDNGFFNRMVFHRWMAMSAIIENNDDGGGGGWMSDYDVFPLDTAFSSNDNQQDQYLNAQNLPPLPDTITLYEKVAPSLVAGTAKAWQETTQALMDRICGMVQEQEDDNNDSNNRRGVDIGVGLYWTDTLGLLELWREQKVRVEARVVSMERAAVAIHRGIQEHHCSNQTNKNNVTAHYSHPRAVRNKWAVHVSPRSLVTLSLPPPPVGRNDDAIAAASSSSFSKLRLPRHRATVARQWLKFLGQGLVNRTHYRLCSATSENQ